MDVGFAARRRSPAWAVLWALVVAHQAGCSGFLGTTASSFMRVVREDQDPNRRFLAYQKLADTHCYTSEDQKARATELLAERLKSADEPIATRAMICRTLGEIGRPEARPALLASLEDPDPLIRSEAARALGRVAQPDDSVLLARVMAADTNPDCRLAAIEGLGQIKDPDPRAYVVLVEGMESDDPAVRLASVRSLRSMTGQDLGVSPEPWREFARSRMAAVEGSAETVAR